MKELKLVQEIYLYNGRAVDSDKNPVSLYSDCKELCQFISNYGADMLLVNEFSTTDAEHELNIDAVKEIVSVVDIPVILGGNVNRLEDVKKYLYTGAIMAVLNMEKDSNKNMVKEASDRFGKDKIAILTSGQVTMADCDFYKEQGAALILKNSVSPDDMRLSLPVMYINNTGDENNISNTIKLSYNENIYGYGCKCQTTNVINYSDLKIQCKNDGLPVKIYEPALNFSDLKSNNDGLVPVVVQDYQTNDVLMVAYMNEEAFNCTIKTGRMTYFSRSRNELWEKGLTSGHFQYFKELYADCDNDTILAKVFQVGAACHTGKKSCFFKEIVKKDYVERNPNKVFEDVFNVILDRKENPKEGSYTNYLFDKGIDKILKKVGEEATEIVIAAKNPNPEEIKYEISDFLYHVMVLMAEKGVTWEDITTELARR